MKNRTNGAAPKAAKTIGKFKNLICNWPTLDMDVDLWRDSKGKLLVHQRGVENGHFVDEVRPVSETAALRCWLLKPFHLTQKTAMAMLGIRERSCPVRCYLENPIAHCN
jgi:hypothetical protein